MIEFLSEMDDIYIKRYKQTLNSMEMPKNLKLKLYDQQRNLNDLEYQASQKETMLKMEMSD